MSVSELSNAEEEQRTENPCVPGSIPGGTTENPDSKWSQDFFVSHRNTKVSEYIITGIPKEPDTNWNFALKMAINMPELPIVSQQTSGR